MRVAIHSATMPLPIFFSELDEELFFIGLRLTLSVASFSKLETSVQLELIDGFKTDRLLIAFLRRFDLTVRSITLRAAKKT